MFHLTCDNLMFIFITLIINLTKSLNFGVFELVRRRHLKAPHCSGDLQINQRKLLISAVLLWTKCFHSTKAYSGQQCYGYRPKHALQRVFFFIPDIFCWEFKEIIFTHTDFQFKSTTDPITQNHKIWAFMPKRESNCTEHPSRPQSN